MMRELLELMRRVLGPRIRGRRLLCGGNSPPALVAWASMRRPRFYVRRDNVQPVPSALVRAARRPREFSMHASSYRCLGTLLAFLRGDC